MNQTQPEHIQLQAQEDVVSVRDRLSFIRGKRVLLIWPEEGTALQRKLDLVLVQREARRRALQLALVTHDLEVMHHAKELGMSCFETIAASERSRWKRGRTRVFIQRHHKPDDSPDPTELMPVASRVRAVQRNVSALRHGFERLLILLIVLGAIGGTAYVALPSAEVYLQPAQAYITVQTTLRAEPQRSDVNIETRQMPATVLRALVQTSGTRDTSGVAQLDSIPAIGTVIFTNQTDRAVTIPTNTMLSTSAGTPIRFRTLNEVTVRAGVGERAEVAIEAMADSVGEIGNVGTGLINLMPDEFANRVTVRNLSPTSGGQSRQFAVVTTDDLERLLFTVQGELQRLAYEQMQANLSSEQLIVIETIRIVETRSEWTVFSHGAGALSDTVSLEMRAIVEAIAIDDRFARQIVFAELSAQNPPDLALLPERFLYTRGAVQEITPEQHIILGASGEALAVAQLDAAKLRDGLAGLPLEAASRWLAAQVRLESNTVPELRVFPHWLTHMPLLPMRITINIGAGS